MAGEKHAERLKDSRGRARNPKTGPDHHDEKGLRAGTGPESGAMLFFRHHGLSLIIFLFSLFFIITISNPAIFLNDEWITANQLHQLDTGHQVTFSEGKYGVTENGTVSAYFTSRQNVLMYSLALPVAALPFVKIFGLFGDNFRLLVIMGWSLCLVFIALIIDAGFPEYSRIRGIRILSPVMGLALVLFMGNVLLYKQFPFSAPDAPFEVAALVLTNHLLFALMVTVVFETLRLILNEISMALFGTFACIASSSYIFWATAVKDHMLTTTVLALIIFFYVLYLSYGRTRDATLAFFCSGLLIWVRPEIGFFVTLFSGLFFCIPLLRKFFKKETGQEGFIRSLIPMAGVFFGGIPFFINNLLVNHNLLIPVIDLPRSLEQSGSVVTVPLSREQVMATAAAINQTYGLDFPATISRLWEMVSHSMLSGFTFDNLGSGFIGLMAFPKNDNIGFFIMCPLFFIAIVAFILWNQKILGKTNDKNTVLLFLVVMVFTVFFSYIMRFSSMNTSHGIIPDMRYLSPAYVPAGLLSILILSRTPFLRKPGELLKTGILGTVVFFPVSMLVMILIHPFGSSDAGYFAFYKFIILGELLLCSGLMILVWFYRINDGLLFRAFPYLLVLTLITVLSFQFMLTSFYAMIEKMNGYPFWLPLVREGFNLFFVVHYLPPV